MSSSEVLDQPSQIAIIGMAGQFPGARNIKEYWRNLCGGVESVTFFTADQLRSAGVDEATIGDPSYVRAGGVLDGADLFDAEFFGINPREAEATDPQQRLFLECAWESLEDAGYDSHRYKGPIGVYAGVGVNGYLFNLLSTEGFLEPAGIHQALIGNSPDYLTTRVSYKLNLKGPSVTVQTSCSTSLVAVHLACQGLLSGDCDMALSGGVRMLAFQSAGYQYEEGGIVSPDGRCRAFDASAQGTVSGDGVGVVVLKRLTDAIADGDNIYAVIRGSSVNNDGSAKVGYTAPGVDGQCELIRRAHLIAEVDARSITYVEAHGTGTVLGDPIEIAALTRAFWEGTREKGYCAIGSVKTNIGHLDTAAGVAGLIKVALALKHGLIPASLNYRKGNPLLDIENTPFYVNTELREWKREGAKRRRAGVSSFGIGGTNAHVILEEAPELEVEESKRREHVLVVSGRSRTSLEQGRDRLRKYLEERGEETGIADIAYTLQAGRRAFRYRRSMV
ncbi:MAG: type I polyketide synthase, partial [Blastocatellia bacterium]